MISRDTKSPEEAETATYSTSLRYLLVVVRSYIRRIKHVFADEFDCCITNVRRAVLQVRLNRSMYVRLYKKIKLCDNKNPDTTYLRKHGRIAHDDLTKRLHRLGAHEDVGCIKVGENDSDYGIECKTEALHGSSGLGKDVDLSKVILGAEWQDGETMSPNARATIVETHLMSKTSVVSFHTSRKEVLIFIPKALASISVDIEPSSSSALIFSLIRLRATDRSCATVAA
jgi:hypothetical protein